jgi:Family of unknown function (DUF6502)
MATSPPPAAFSAEHGALLLTFKTLLRPIAQLALSKGVSYSALDELLRETMVGVSKDQYATTPSHGLVSKVSTATGLNRREVTRLLSVDAPAPAKRWLAGELFTKWLSDPLYKQDNKPLVLARQGPAPSFESLAQAVSKDVHPRSFLDELCRLGMAHLDEVEDCVALSREALVPKNDFAKMVSFLADNVGDHLAGTVTNVLSAGNAHFDQAVLADELSTQSIAQVEALITVQWRALFDALVPTLEQLIEADRAHGRVQDQQIRIGLYSFTRPMAPKPVAADVPALDLNNP